jgi:hypothetical protein
LDEGTKVTHRLPDLHIAECGDPHVSYRQQQSEEQDWDDDDELPCRNTTSVS